MPRDQQVQSNILIAAMLRAKEAMQAAMQDEFIRTHPREDTVILVTNMSVSLHPTAQAKVLAHSVDQMRKATHVLKGESLSESLEKLLALPLPEKDYRVMLSLPGDFLYAVFTFNPSTYDVHVSASEENAHRPYVITEMPPDFLAPPPYGRKHTFAEVQQLVKLVMKTAAGGLRDSIRQMKKVGVPRTVATIMLTASPPPVPWEVTPLTDDQLLEAARRLDETYGVESDQIDSNYQNVLRFNLDEVPPDGIRLAICIPHHKLFLTCHVSEDAFEDAENIPEPAIAPDADPTRKPN
jgi:hypothetical protein